MQPYAALVPGQRLRGLAETRLYTQDMTAQPRLTIHAELRAKPGQEATLRELLLGLIEPTRKEAGCLQYDLHEDNDQAGLFFFYENWVSRAHLDAHLASPHVGALLAREDELLAEPARLVFATRLA